MISATFFENNSATIPFVPENQETSWQHRFLTFSKHTKLTKNKPQWYGPPWIPEQDHALLTRKIAVPKSSSSDHSRSKEFKI